MPRLEVWGDLSTNILLNASPGSMQLNVDIPISDLGFCVTEENLVGGSQGRLVSSSFHPEEPASAQRHPEQSTGRIGPLTTSSGHKSGSMGEGEGGLGREASLGKDAPKQPVAVGVNTQLRPGDAETPLTAIPTAQVDQPGTQTKCPAPGRAAEVGACHSTGGVGTFLGEVPPSAMGLAVEGSGMEIAACGGTESVHIAGVRVTATCKLPHVEGLGTPGRPRETPDPGDIQLVVVNNSAGKAPPVCLADSRLLSHTPGSV
jgi:hypothetical protein